MQSAQLDSQLFSTGFVISMQLSQQSDIKHKNTLCTAHKYWVKISVKKKTKSKKEYIKNISTF